MLLRKTKMMMIVLLLYVSQHASGVEVYEGVESVLLPCPIPADVSSTPTSAVWNRDGLTNPTVHLRDEDGDNLGGQNDRYLSRTSMRVDALQTGDLSLTLRNPTVSDSGTYTCTAVSYGDRLSRSEVQLKVSEPPVWPKVLSAVLVALIILTAAFGLSVCCAYKRMKDREDFQVEVVEVTEGEESVLLPFKTTADLREAGRVEWRLTQPKRVIVHVYERVKSLPDVQDQGYRGRTEMNEDPLGTKDLSLTLKHLHLTDSGVYTCTVIKDNSSLLKKSVTLSVRVSQPEVVTEGEESVLLPFKTTADLPEDVTVEWTRSDSNNMKVHVYESGNNQPDKQHQGYRGRTEMDEDPLNTKDLSLTLKDLRPTDSGYYTCTIYKKDGNILLQKSLSLRVIESLPDIVQVPKEQESVPLPFKTTADLPEDVTVEWTRSDSNNMMVHVYESGNNQPDKQDQGYRGRTEMKEDPLRTGDLSLTLKDLHLTDSGVYTCTVYNKDGKKLLQKSVTLHVYDKRPERIVTQCGDKSLMLPFKITDELPVISTVEWKLIYPKYNLIQKKYIHMGNEGDLSLTLEDPHPTDSGYYTGTVYNKDGNILLQQSVSLRVIDFQVEMVEVKEGEESVLLPFKTTADLRPASKVEWSLAEPTDRYVHVYESGNNQPVKQDQGYRGRTEMNKDPLRTGDLSLTLKHLHLDDSETYICTVCNKNGETLLKKSVTLSVRATLKGTMEDMFPCLRRRREPNGEVKGELRNMNQEQERLTAEETV